MLYSCFSVLPQIMFENKKNCHEYRLIKTELFSFAVKKNTWNKKQEK